MQVSLASPETGLWETLVCVAAGDAGSAPDPLANQADERPTSREARLSSIALDQIGPAPAAARPARCHGRRAALLGFLLVSVLGHVVVFLLPLHAPQWRGDRTVGRTLAVAMVSETAPAAAPVPQPAASPPTSSPSPAPHATPELVTATPESGKSAATDDAPAVSSAMAPRPLPQPAPAARAARPVDESVAATSAPTGPAGDTAPATEPRPGEAASADGQSRQSDVPDAAALAARVQARLQQALRSSFYYPRIARHRGWEGSVEVGLRVEADGNLSGVRILRTSGFAILDRAALASVGRIERLPEIVNWLGGRHIDMVLPVQYRLIDG